ncbi:MAG: hypothetical protein ACRDH5_06055, partial [bacterium]
MEVSPLWLQPWPQLLIALAIGGFALGLAAARAGARRSREAFKALASDALRDNTESFLALAGERFARLEESSEADWDTRRKALDDTVGPLREALDRVPGPKDALAAALKIPPVRRAAQRVLSAMFVRGTQADFDLRDPDFMREQLAMLWLLSRLYFRADVRE